MLYPFEFPYGFKAAAELRGFHFGVGRLPQTETQRAEHKKLTNILQCILADFELVQRPDAGCAPRRVPSCRAPKKSAHSAPTSCSRSSPKSSRN